MFAENWCQDLKSGVVVSCGKCGKSVCIFRAGFNGDDEMRAWYIRTRVPKAPTSKEKKKRLISITRDPAVHVYIKDVFFLFNHISHL
jgi:hypothetical protein